METAFEFLSRLKWDKSVNAGEYEVFYYDRLQDALIGILFGSIAKIGKSFMEVVREGRIAEIPLHRIREIRRNGKLVWRR